MGSRPTNEERVAWRAEKAFAMEQVLAEIAENPKELGMTRAGAAAKLHAIIEGAPTTSGKMTVDGQLTLAQLVAQSYSADT